MSRALDTLAVTHALLTGQAEPKPPPRPHPLPPISYACMVIPKPGAQAYEVGVQPGYVAPMEDDKPGPAPFVGLHTEQDQVFVMRFARMADYRLQDVTLKGTCDLSK